MSSLNNVQSKPIGSQLDGSRELFSIEVRDSMLGSLLGRMINGVNNVARNAGVAVTGFTPTPPKVDSIQVQGSQSGSTLTAPSEILHWTITHNQAININTHYFTEIATEPNFLQPHVHFHGPSRSGFLSLPTKDSSGNTQTYYIRSYAQSPGSKPSDPTVYGNIGGSIGIQMTGSSETTLLPSTGSGTASTSGEQGGKGFGTVQTRPAPTTKRATIRYA